MKNYTEHIAKGTLAVLAAGLLSTAGGYLLRIYLARNLTIEEYGMFYAIVSFVAFFGIFKEMGLGQAVAKLIPEFASKKEYSKVKSAIRYALTIQFFAGAAIAAGLFLLSDYISANFFHNPSTKVIIQIMSLEFFIGFIALRYMLQGFHKIRLYASVDAMRIALIFAFLIFFVGRGVEGVAYSYLASAVLINAALFAYVFRMYRRYRTEKYDGRVSSRILKFGMTLFAGSIAGVVISSTDVLAITYFLSAKDVGLYQAAMPTSQLLVVFASAITAVLLPSVSEMWHTNRKATLEKSVSMILRFLFIFVIPFSIILATFPEIILDFVFGFAYVDAALLLQILSLSAIFYSLQSIMTSTLIGIGKPGITTKIIVITSVTNLLLTILMINIIGVTGAAVSVTLSYFLSLLLTYRALKSQMVVNFDIPDLAKMLLGAVISVAIIIAIKGMLVMEPLPEAVIILVPGLAFYSAFVLMTGVVRKTDIKLLEEMNIGIPRTVLNLLYRIVRS